MRLGKIEGESEKESVREGVCARDCACASVMQCVAVCCSMLKCVAVRCSVCCSVSQCVCATEYAREFV